MTSGFDHFGFFQDQHDIPRKSQMVFHQEFSSESPTFREAFLGRPAG